jgi:hypothetical protein
MSPVYRKHCHAGKGKENKVVEAARSLMGLRLSQFLLSGYGEAHGTYRRTFIAKVGKGSSETVRQFEMINDSELGLPAGRDPAVLAALLHLPVAKDQETDVVSFRDHELRRILGWSNLPGAGITIEQAIERYFSTAYYIVGTRLPRLELLGGRYSNYRRLIGSYQTVTEETSGMSTENTVLTTINFPLNFITNLAAERKPFLNTDFGTLLSLEQLS